MAVLPIPLDEDRSVSLDAKGPTRILIVDDEPMVREVVTKYLERDGFRVDVAADGLAALEAVDKAQPDLVVLDVMLPGADGLTVLRELRSKGSLPVILLTARTDEADRVVGLEVGADDYVVKPFSPRELVARVKTVLRRIQPAVSKPSVAPNLSFDGLEIDTAAREVSVRDQAAELTPREFDLLVFLASAPRQVFSRAQILDNVWDSSAEWQDPATVTVHVRRLRQKLEADPENPRWLATVWGVGYRFEP